MSNLPVTQAAPSQDAAIIEQAVIAGDLSNLTPQMRMQYYMKVCDSLGLNPFTKPFDYIKLNGKLTLYAKRDATDQLRKTHGVSINITSRDTVAEVYIVTAQAVNAEGRTDEATGAVCISGLKGENLANAMMKAETKAKRRVTLSICGLGWMDETEAPTVPGASFVEAEHPTPEVLPIPATTEPVKETPRPRLVNDDGSVRKMTDAQIKRMWALTHKHGVAEEALADYIQIEMGFEKPSEIPIAKADSLFQWIESHPVAADARK